MKRIGTLGLSALFLAACIMLTISPVCFAKKGSTDPATWVTKDAPQTYVVKDGDTLWDIACIFLNDPWRWKQVWYSNPEIENPDLIYPGDKLTLRYLEGKPQIHVERGTSWRTVDKRTGIVKLRPRIRSLPSERPIPTIPMTVIGPFFNKSTVINANQASKSPCITGLGEDHIVVGTGDRIYVSGLSERIPDTVFSILRPGRKLIDPETKRCLGIEGLVLGKAERDVKGDGCDTMTRFVISESNAEIKAGDRLIGTLEEELDPNFMPKAPINLGEGQIISVFDGISQIGQYQIVVITGGEDMCREIGDVLAVNQIQKDIPSRYLFAAALKFRFAPTQVVNIPPTRVGTCVVFRVFETVSFALVMDATQTIYLHDDVASP